MTLCFHTSARSHVPRQDKPKITSDQKALYQRWEQADAMFFILSQRDVLADRLARASRGPEDWGACMFPRVYPRDVVGPHFSFSPKWGR